jgi:hypothetical protein
MSLSRYFQSDTMKILGGAAVGYGVSALAGDKLQSVATSARQGVQSLRTSIASLFGGSNTSTAKTAAQGKSLLSMFSGASKENVASLTASADARAAAGTGPTPTPGSGGIWASIINFFRVVLA